MTSNDGQEDNEKLKLSAWRKKRLERKQQKKQSDEEAFWDADDDGDVEDSFVPISKRKRMEDELLGGHRRRFRNRGKESSDMLEGEEGDKNKEGKEQEQEEQVESLLESAAALQKTLTEEQRAEKQQNEEEERIMKEASKVQT